MKFEVINDNKKKTLFKDVLVGTLVEYQEQTCLRTYTGLVSLTNPENTWTGSSYTNDPVIILPKGAKVTLTQE